MAKTPESFMFTVGKLDAGMAILLGERAHLIEFPSILLPSGATAGSIVNIAVVRNLEEEKKRDQDFWDLQKEIYDTYGVQTPKPPQLEVRNVTQTSVTLEWPALEMATSKLRSLDIYRNGERLAAIPQPLHNTSTKLSGLELNTDYTFQLILRTTAGTFPSNVARVRTHTMTDTSGISVCFGTVQDNVMFEDVKQALQEMRARWSDKIQIDTTHFVCTTPAGEGNTGPGVEYQRALQLSIPIVQPQWILACHAERKMIPIAQFYLGTTPNVPLNSAPFTRPQSMSQVNLQRSPTKESVGSPIGSANRASMPPQRKTQAEASASTFLNQEPSKGASGEPTVPEEDENEYHKNVKGKGKEDVKSSNTDGHTRNGTIDRNFKFPPDTKTQTPPPPVPPLPPSLVLAQETETVAESEPSSEALGGEDEDGEQDENDEVEVDDEEEYKSANEKSKTSLSSSTAPIEVPPPDPVEKEKERTDLDHEGDDDIGATEEISLN